MSSRLWNRNRKSVQLLSVTAFVFAQFPSIASAQILPDATLPNNSIVTPNGSLNEITGGTTAGGNLFHSFEQFSLPTGSEAFFNQALTIDNIITRVTGGSISNIDGLIRANGTANLFLLNPNGIVLGPNATLNIGGSFLGSTADSIQFEDGSSFSATNPETSPLLTVSVPMGLQYGANPGAITAQGTGNNLFLDNAIVIRVFRPDGFQVADGQTLALVGGNVSLEGANLTARDGRIELGSVGGESLVRLNPNNSGFALSYEEVSQFQDINLSNTASVETSGNGGGNIQVQGRRVTFTDGSAMLADTLGDGTGGSLTIRGSEVVDLSGTSSFTPPPRDGQTFDPFSFNTRLSTDVGSFPESTGNGGTLLIETDGLRVADGAQISTGTFSAGNSGTLTVVAPTVELISGAPIVGSSGLYAPAAPDASGNGGIVNINADRLQVTDGALVFAGTLGTGDAGTIAVQANEVDLVGTSPGERPVASGLSIIAISGSTGQGGSLTIEAHRLRVADGARVSVSTFGSGNAGNLTVVANEVELISGARGVGSSGLFASVEADATGNGGSLTIDTESLRIADGAQAAVLTFGAGNAGNLAVRATDIELTGTSPGGNPSGLLVSAEVGSTGNGGNLLVDVDRLRVAEGAQIAVSTGGSGSGGELTLRASGSVELTGTSESTRSGLFSNAIVGNGAGGDINVTTNRLTLQEGAAISASNFQSQGQLAAGQGAAGNINIDAPSIRIDNESFITAETVVGNRGNISLLSQDLRLRRGSQITTNAGSSDGGNITINTDTLAALENSDITANAQQGFGGRVVINAEGLFGTEFQEQLTPESDITATSALGPEFNGIVQINTPDVDPASGLIELPENVVDATGLIAQTCPATAGSEFFVTGRGSLPEDPSQPLRGEVVWEDLRPLERVRAENSQSLPHRKPLVEAPQLVEAQGWILNAEGQVELVAKVPNATPQPPRSSVPNCP